MMSFFLMDNNGNCEQRSDCVSGKQLVKRLFFDKPPGLLVPANSTNLLTHFKIAYSIGQKYTGEKYFFAVKMSAPGVC